MAVEGLSSNKDAKPVLLQRAGPVLIEGITLSQRNVQGERR